MNVPGHIVAGKNATRARLHPHDRSAVLEDIAARWAQPDPGKYLIMRQMATQLPEHDDRTRFPVGIDLILAGRPARRIGPDFGGSPAGLTTIR